jgi:Ni/Co efflux regulator RcnB
VSVRILASYGSQVIRKEMQMKRPATFVIVASMLASASAFAAGNPHVTRSIAERIVNDRGHDDRGHDDHGSDNRGHDNRGNTQSNNHQNNHDDRGNHAPPVIVHRDNDRHDNDRRDWNDHRNDHPGNDRPDNNRHDWNDHRNDRPDNNRHDWNDHRNDRPDNNRHDWNDHRNDRPDSGRWDRYRNDWDRHPHYNDNRRYDRRDYARYRYDFGFYHPPRGYYSRAWQRGDRLPSAYYGRSYVVYDWQPYRLYEPPYGYNWVRVGNDVVLTAIATGVVLDVLYDIWY